MEYRLRNCVIFSAFSSLSLYYLLLLYSRDCFKMFTLVYLSAFNSLSLYLSLCIITNLEKTNQLYIIILKTYFLNSGPHRIAAYHMPQDRRRLPGSRQG
jgi:hypothetical protein